MRRVALFLSLLILHTESVRAEIPVPRSSSRQEVALTLAGRRVAVDYGRPARQGRPIFGGLVPYGEVWRTGADEATRLTTEADLLLAGGLLVPKGSYALFTLPGAERWLLIVSRVSRQWGAFNYDPAHDLGRVPLHVDKVGKPIERLSIKLQGTGERSGVLWLGWERTVLSIAFETLPEPPAVTSNPALYAPRGRP